ncbi:MAG: substrate-binding domain-containing protein [Muribaculaceae bacterium]|nr:substrate-binding domain-containing protein [Muribaculaceae bacterium]
MNLTSRILFGLLAISLLAPLTGCRKEKTYKIGISQCSQDDWRAKMNEEIQREMMFHEDAEVEIRSADDDNARQISDLQYFADNGFDIIIVAPNEARPLTPAIKDLYAKGMPIIIFDRNITDSTYTARIGVDNVGLGSAAARYAMHLRPGRPNAIEIYGLHGSTPADDRHKGFATTFTESGGNLIGSVEGRWNPEYCMAALDSMLRLHPETDIIYAHNDRMAIGASEVARRLGRRDIGIIGIDAAPEIGIKAVADSVIDATFLYPTEGQRLIRTALAILKGEPYEKEVLIPPASAVDRSNADILLIQDRALHEETDKMKFLKTRIDTYWERHSSQTFLFYASIVIIVLLMGVVFLVLRAYWQHRRHQAVLLRQNRLLEEERDKQKILNEKLEEATQSKLMFFTTVSHDLRTPLTLIAEPVARVAEAPNLTDTQRELMRVADRNVRILMRLINQILDFRKYELSKTKLNLSEIRLGEALRDWAGAFAGLARRRDIRLTIDIPAEYAGEQMAVDCEKMERVVFNLLSNAIKFTPDNGHVGVRLDIDREKQQAVITVSDTGEGISERDLARIFEHFYQADNANPHGSGIGLTLSKAFVELHGGTITARSRAKEGSVFTVTLPIRHVAQSVVQAESRITAADVEAELCETDVTAEFDNDRPLLLVIDDNSDIRSLVSALLGDTYNVITASNGSEGVRKAMKYVPDIIICDVMMPVMDGLQCCKAIKAEVTTSHIPVLMLTACAMDEQRVEGYESGADGYLSKPFSNEVLRSMCASLVANRRRIKDLWKSDVVLAAPARSAAAEETLRKETPKRDAAMPGSDIDSDFYRRFLDILEKEMGNPDMNVDALAGRMGLERSQFYRKIKALTNYSPVELIRKMRLQRAHQLLVSTEKSVSEIAYEVGFSTPAYFTKCYREAYGRTPTAVRAGT